MKELKFLYETTVSKQANESVKESRSENGETVEVTRSVKKVKPVKLALLKPDRRLFKDAEIFAAVALSEYLKKGLLPYSLVAKRYANDGGPLTDSEKKRIENLETELLKLQEEFYTFGIKVDPEQQKRKNEILVRITRINTEANNIKNAYIDIFNSTAEMKARNDEIEWWVLFLMYIDRDGTGYKPFFGDGDYQSRVAALEIFEDNENPFEQESIKKLSYLASFWFTARNALTKQDFESMDKLFIEQISTYKLEETGEDIKVKDTTPVAESPTEPVPETN